MSLVTVMLVAIDDNLDLAFAQITPAAEKTNSSNVYDSGPPAYASSHENDVTTNNEGARLDSSHYEDSFVPALPVEPAEPPTEGVDLGSIGANFSNSLQQQIYDEVRDAMNASGITDPGF